VWCSCTSSISKPDTRRLTGRAKILLVCPRSLQPSISSLLYTEGVFLVSSFDQRRNRDARQDAGNDEKYDDNWLVLLFAPLTIAVVLVR
jgi:hypothetical protein